MAYYKAKKPYKTDQLEQGIILAKYIIENQCTLTEAGKKCFPELSIYPVQMRFYMVKDVDEELYNKAREAQAKGVEISKSKNKIRNKPLPILEFKIDEAVIKSQNRMKWLKNNIKAGNIVDYRISRGNIVEIEVTKTFSNYFYGKIKGYLEECYYYQQIVKVCK